MNLILTPTMFLPLSSYEDLGQYLDDYFVFKGFLLDQNVRLYKEQSLEDEIMEQINSILDKSTKKQLEYKTRLIFQRPTPIDLEQVSNVGDWDLIFDYIDDTLLTKQANGFTGLDMRNIETVQSYQIRFVYTKDSWYKWRVYFWKQKDIISTIREILPNKILTSSFALNFEDIDEIKSIRTEEQLKFYSTHIYERMQQMQDGEKINLAFRIAKDNGYFHDTNLSNFNSKNKKKVSKRKISIRPQNTRREIFKNADCSIYLSLDFENYQFEVYNSKGEHQGVWNFAGKKTKDADTTGNHDIIIP